VDALAVCYAAELNRRGIETSIIVPGAFTSGTNHFAHAGSLTGRQGTPGRIRQQSLAHLGDDIMKGFAAAPMPMWLKIGRLSPPARSSNRTQWIAHK